ncbi:glycerophosphodiester phosphodiesterase [Ureibacillus sp. FSL K6-8385]|uniref:Glycerophosphodiester phosphodiesterase n=1 Tax=Ureibacillus terrenus TaxID=118246 RepID=A0A540V449_9BACL|nr:glycerophosphodiester phosphodiesterase [Ureibacillus terrenus]MED3660292.1 glycerophosphodiester phosphodiesterase [Ureibacillus terrenus]MED3764962.1 glycerophosphodiester phosphodiesterase [Ureibacillus terrenus]TQE91521.1 glycerophosphodiester phosphodiesterase [Ureibacillus terrenus]
MGKKTKLALAIAAASAAAWAGSKAFIKPQKREGKEVLKKAPVVLAHRGGAKLAPEHTMIAFEKAFEFGVDGFEIDVRLTKDEEIVVIHDETIDRTSDGMGSVKDFTLEELRNFNFAFHFKDGEGNYPYRNQKAEIVTLKELFEKFPNMYINIDIKDSPETYEGSLMPSKLWRLIEECHAEDRVVVTSFYSEQVDRFNLYAQNRVALGAGETDVRKAFTAFTSQFGHLYHPKVDVFQIPTKHGRFSLDSPKFIAYLNNFNIPVHYWVIDDEEQMMKLLDKGAQGIITDRPDIAVPLVRNWIEKQKEKGENQK